MHSPAPSLHITHLEHIRIVNVLGSDVWCRISFLGFRHTRADPFCPMHEWPDSQVGSQKWDQKRAQK